MNKKMLKGSAFAATLIIPVILVMTAILVPALVGWSAKAEQRTSNSAAKQLYVNAQAIMQEFEEEIDNPDRVFYGYYDESTDPEFTAEMYRKFPDLENCDDWYVEITTESSEYYDPRTVVLAYVNDGGSEGYYPEDGIRADDK